MSRTIQQLEAELDEQLFIRTGRTVHLTPAGATVVDLGRRVSTDIRDVTTALRERRQQLTGRIRLVGGMTVCLYVYPTLIRAFQAAHPQVEVKVTPGAMPRIVRKLLNGTADVGLLTMPVDDRRLQTEPVLSEELVLVSSPVHTLTRRAAVRARDLATLPFVLFEGTSNTRRRIEQFFAAEDLRPRIVSETDNVEVVKALVRQGTGVTIVPFQAVAREVRAGQLHATRITGHQLVRETAWVHVRSEPVPRLWTELKRTLRQVQSRLELVPGDEVTRA